MYDDSRHEITHRKTHFLARLSPTKLRDARMRRSQAKSEPLNLSTAMPIIVQSPTPTDEESVTITLLPQSISRRKSRLERWIDGQDAPDAHPKDDMITQGSSQRPHPYLAYSNTRRARSASCGDDSGSISESFVLVDGNDETGEPRREELNIFEEATPLGLGTPPSTRGHTYLLRTPPSLRAFRFSLNSPRPASPSPHDSSPSLHHHSTLQRPPFSMGRHGRAVSDGSLAPTHLQYDTNDTPPAGHSNSFGSWTFKRPSVLGTFTPSDASADEGSASHLSPPRPSFSSSLTFSSGTTGVSTDPCTPHLGTPSSASSSRPRDPQQSLWSLPPNASHLHDTPNAETSVHVRPGTLRLPFSLKTSGKTFRHVPSMLPISRDKRKKKLVVSGIAKDDQLRLEGVRKWCESFGEVNQITRMPNGDLHIDFRKAEVADTVCRINARVHIAGVGSVSLSWYSGKKP